MTLVERWAEEDLAELERLSLRRRLRPLASASGRLVRVDGRELLSFCSNDYLGLCSDARVVQALSEAARSFGVGSGSSRLVVGDLDLHHALEDALATWLGAETAVVFGSGYLANAGAIGALVGEQDVVFSDALNHASIIDGCRLSRAARVVYPHNDVDALRQLLSRHPGRRRLVVTESVFSMDGDRAPLRELVSLCRAQNVALMVDEAHAIGVLGARGAGLCEALGVEHDVDLRVGTVGKALGGYGAFVAGPTAAVDLLKTRARTFVYSTGLPGPLCSAALRAVEIASTDHALRGRLWAHIEHLAGALGTAPASAVFPLVLGAPDVALGAERELWERGILVKAIRPPTVPEGTSRLRVSLSAMHTREDVDRLVRAVRELPGVTLGANTR